MGCVRLGQFRLAVAGVLCDPTDNRSPYADRLPNSTKKLVSEGAEHSFYGYAVSVIRYEETNILTNTTETRIEKIPCGETDEGKFMA